MKKDLLSDQLERCKRLYTSLEHERIRRGYYCGIESIQFQATKFVFSSTSKPIARHPINEIHCCCQAPAMTFMDNLRDPLRMLCNREFFSAVFFRSHSGKARKCIKPGK
jgi:hypothetical protein